MAETVMGMAIAPDDAVDLVVLAYAIPDITPGRATAAYLSHICPGNRLAFAVCDQGVAAAFTGLRLIREYARTGGGPGGGPGGFGGGGGAPPPPGAGGGPRAGPAPPPGGRGPPPAGRGGRGGGG